MALVEPLSCRQLILLVSSYLFLIVVYVAGDYEIDYDKSVSKNNIEMSLAIEGRSSKIYFLYSQTKILHNVVVSIMFRN